MPRTAPTILLTLTALTLAAPASALRPGELDMLRQYEQRNQRHQQEKEQANEQWMKDYQAKKELKQAEKEDRVAPGMTARQATRIMGRGPDKIYRSNYGRGVEEQWCYYGVGRTVYIYVNEGKVTAVQY